MATILATGCDSGLGAEFARADGHRVIARPHPPFGATDYPLWRRILETNLIGPMKMAECFVEHVARSELKVMAFVSRRTIRVAPTLIARARRVST